MNRRSLLAAAAAAPWCLGRASSSMWSWAPCANERSLVVLELVGGNDGLNTVIPVDHAQKLPSLENSQVFVFDRAGHFPHKDHPEDFSRLLVDFCQSQPPAAYHRGKWRRLLTRGDQAGLTTVELAESSPASSPASSPSAVS